jgi:hypothetical protein
VALFPIDPDTDKIFTETYLRPYFSVRETSLNVSSFPTGDINVDAAAHVGSSDYLNPLLAATSGSLAIVADGLGYGESQKDANRTTLWNFG